MKKTIKLSFHPSQRRKQRGLTEEQILHVIERPEYFKKMPDGRKIAVKTIRNRAITVIYVEDEKLIRVVTVF